MTDDRSIAMPAGNALAWTAVLGSVAMMGSYAFACVFPFAALAAIAALTLDSRRALLLVAAVVVANQVVGFALLHYPHQVSTYAWTGFIGGGALAALGAALLVRGKGDLLSARAPLALVAAIAGYQAVMFAGAVVLNGFASSTPAIVARIALNDAAWFVALAAVRLVLTRALPATFGTAVRFA